MRLHLAPKLTLQQGNIWFVLVGAVACGMSAGLFWASEGAAALGYPPPSKRGQYMNIWLVFRTLGPIMGGAILLGMNQYVTCDCNPLFPHADIALVHPI
jgi:MFS family permease